MAQKLGSLFIDGEGSVNDKSGNNLVVNNYNVNIDTEVKRFDQSSLYFNNAYLSVPLSSSFSFDSDFTIDFWANLTGQGSYTTPITTSSNGNGAGGWWLQLGQGNGFWFLYDYRGPNQIIFADAALFAAFGNLTNQGWFHFALVRSNGVISVYKNGVLISSISYSANIVSTNPLSVGTLDGAANTNLNGNMDNIRIVKGEALWTSNFELTEEALFYKADVPVTNPYVRPDNVKGLYNISLKAGIRNAAKNGFVRPTLAEMFMSHKDFVEVPSTEPITPAYLELFPGSNGVTISEDKLTSSSSLGNWHGGVVPIPKYSGKWYLEFTDNGSGGAYSVGVRDVNETAYPNHYAPDAHLSYLWHNIYQGASGGNIYQGAGDGSAVYPRPDGGDIMAVGYDIENHVFTVYREGELIHTYNANPFFYLPGGIIFCTGQAGTSVTIHATPTYSISGYTYI